MSETLLSAGVRFPRLTRRLRARVRDLVREPARAAARCALAGGLVLATACGGAESTGPGDTNAPGEATQITASVNEVRLGAIGASSQLTAQLTDAKGRVVPTGSMSWSSNDITIADVSGSGGVAIVTGRAPGRTTIRVSGGALFLDIPVTVTAARGITLGPSTLSLRVGDQYKYLPTVDADAGATPELRWTTDDVGIATVASDGTVTAVSLGTTAVRVSVVGDARLSAVGVLTVIPPRSLRLSPATLSVAALESAPLTAVVDVNAGESTALTWTSANAGVATVSSTGLVTGVTVGSTFIRAASVVDPRARDSVAVQVTAMRAVAVSPASVTLAAGETRTFTAQVNLGEGANQAVIWRSANPAVAMIASNGMVTGVSQGTTTITAIAVADTTKRTSAEVAVIAVVRDIDVQPAALSLFTGEARALTATVTADAGASQQATWRSSNPAVATVSATGTVTGVTAGSAIITATAVGDTTRTASALVTVRSAPTVSVTPATLSLGLTESQSLVATVVVPPGTSSAVTWSSSNAALAAVSANGTVTGVGFGTATITATSVADPSASGSAVITVVPRVTAISVTPSNSLVAPGGTVQLTPTVVAQGGLSTAVTYRSSNPSVASVNFAGLVSALANGSSTVTVVSVADTTKQATATVTVSSGPQRVATSWSASRLGSALHEDVVSLSALDQTTAFAVNSLGDVYRYDGSAWQMSAPGGTHGTRFLSVSAAGGTAVAVGTNGVMVQWTGSAWSAVNTGTTATLNSVWLENASTGFAVGTGGTALRLSGGTWLTTSSGSTQTLNAVWSVGGVAYAVGNAGEILKFSGSSWTRHTPITTESLYGVSGRSATEVVAVGSFGTVLRFTAMAWTKVNTTESADLYGVATDAGSGTSFIASDAALLQLSGNTVSTVSTPYAPRLFSVTLDPDGRLWTGGQRGSVMRNATTWETVSLAPDLIDVWSTSSSAAWAVGEFGSIYRWSGAAWTRVPTATTATLNSVWAASANDAFAGGDNGTMLRWNGSAWTTMTFPSSASVYGLWGTSGSNVYAATSGGEVVHWNGTVWQSVASVGSALWAVHGTSATNIIATGENGVAVRYNGTLWVPASAPSTGTLAGVYASTGLYLSVGAANTGLAGVAYSSANGIAWSPVSTGSTRILTSIWGPTSSDLYATGEQGTILRYNGSGWSSMATGTTDLLWSVASASDGTAGFAVGYNSTLLTASSSGALRTSRTALNTAAANLNPRAGAKLVRGALPSGSQRALRKRR